MSNHVHLLIETGLIPLSKIMQGIQQSYTAYFHKKYNSVGHVFQGSYKAILCQRDAYLLELVRYIHLNPVRAGIVDDPSEYFWCSHNVYLGRIKKSFIEKDFIFKMFSENEESGEMLYRQFIQDGLTGGIRDIFNDVVDQVFLGRKDFIEGIKKKNKKQKHSYSQLKGDITRSLLDEIFLRKKPLAEILNAVTDISGVPSECILGQSRERVIAKARSLFVFVAVRCVGFNNKSVSRFLGREFNTISYMIRKVDEEIRKDAELQEWLNRITEVLEA